jgi:hypothetical protein
MYFGHLIDVTPEWLDFALSRKERSGLCIAPDYSATGVGDPVFIFQSKDREPSIHLHTRVSFRATTTVAQALASWGTQLGARSESDLGRLFPRLTLLAPDSQVDVLVLLESMPVTPAIPLKSVGIELPVGADYRECNQHEVLRILQALPVESRTSWTQRVVGRHNDIR